MKCLFINALTYTKQIKEQTCQFWPVLVIAGNSDKNLLRTTLWKGALWYRQGDPCANNTTIEITQPQRYIVIDFSTISNIFLTDP